MNTATTTQPRVTALILALLRSAPGPLSAARIASVGVADVAAVQVELDALLAAGTLRRGVTKQGENGYTLATREETTI
jgi:hypothetical protein